MNVRSNLQAMGPSIGSQTKNNGDGWGGVHIHNIILLLFHLKCINVRYIQLHPAMGPQITLEVGGGVFTFTI